MVLHHLTLNTGHVHLAVQDNSPHDVITPLLEVGNRKLPPPFDKYSLRSTPIGAHFVGTVSAEGGRPLVTFGVGTDSESLDVWKRIADLYQTLPAAIISRGKPAQKEPPPAPWIAVITMIMEPDEAEWLGSFEQCVAWSWIRKVSLERN